MAINTTYRILKKNKIILMNKMKCKCVIFPLKEEKAEPRINEWLENNSDLNIKFISQMLVDGRRRMVFYYED